MLQSAIIITLMLMFSSNSAYATKETAPVEGNMSVTSVENGNKKIIDLIFP